jgi:hypothetical protein
VNVSAPNSARHIASTRAYTSADGPPRNVSKTLNAISQEPKSALAST